MKQHLNGRLDTQFRNYDFVEVSPDQFNNSDDDDELDEL